jgi:hypothetical protein
MSSYNLAWSKVRRSQAFGGRRVRASSKEIWVYIGAGFFWLFLLLTLSMSDDLAR